MKKTLLAVMALSTAASAAPFNGFYVGADLGAFMSNTSVKGDDDNAQNKPVKNTLGVFGVNAGYNKSFGNMFAGAELLLDAQMSPSSKKINSVTYKYNRGLGFGVAGRVGYKFNDTTAVFAKLSVIASKDRFSAEEGNLTYKYPKASLVRFVPAIGVEKAFGNVSVNGTLGYDLGRGISSKDNDSNNTVTIKQKGLVAKVGVAYNF